MEAEIVKIESLSANLVTFYTLHIKGRTKNEYFTFEEESLKCGHAVFMRSIWKYIDKLAVKYGAKEFRFRDESPNGHAIPPWNYYPKYLRKKYIEQGHSGLRLYCWRLSDNIVFLFNGGLKTADVPQKCTNCRKPFREMGLFKEALKKALDKGDIGQNKLDLTIDPKYILKII